RPGAAAAALPGLPSLARLADALQHRCLVSLVIVDDQLQAVTVHRGRLALRQLGPVAPVDRELRLARAALPRAARPGWGTGRAVAPHGWLAEAGARLDALLLRSLPAAVDAAELVISPPARFAATPWAILPTARGRPTTVVPSAGAWLDAVGRPG